MCHSTARRIRDGFLQLVNDERVATGAAPLAYHSHLNSCALIRRTEAQSCYSHTRPDGSGFQTVIDTDQYLYATLGENLCMTTHFGGGYYNETYRWTGSREQIESAAEWMFNLFKDSAGHYRNMIDTKYEDTGIGITYDWVDEGIPMFYVAQLFGREVK